MKHEAELAKTATKPDPIAALQVARDRQTESDLDIYREAVFAAAENENFDAADVADVMLRRQWDDAVWKSDVAAAQDDLSQRDFEAGFEKEAARLEREREELALKKIPVPVSLINNLLTRLRLPNAGISLVDIPKDLQAALAQLRDAPYRITNHHATMRTLRTFRYRNTRLFCDDAHRAVQDTRPALRLAAVSDLENRPYDLRSDVYLPAPHPLAS
jgi:hypothetical protein